MSQHRLPTLAHVVYRTRNFEKMLAWHKEVFHASVQHQNPVMAFLTHDDEHHRLAFIDRLAGSPVTARNWATVLKLRELSECITT